MSRSRITSTSPPKANAAASQPTATHGSKSAFVRSMPPGTSAKDIVAKGKSQGINLSISQIYNIRAVDKKRDEGMPRNAPKDARTLKSTAQLHLIRLKATGADGEGDKDEARLRKLIADVGLACAREVIAEVLRAFEG